MYEPNGYNQNGFNYNGYSNISDDMPWFIRIPAIIIGLAFIGASIAVIKWFPITHPFLACACWLLLISIGIGVIFTALGIKPP
jgi:hypothetical protein